MAKTARRRARMGVLPGKRMRDTTGGERGGLLLPCRAAQTQQSAQCKSEQGKMRRGAARPSDGASGSAARRCRQGGRHTGRSGIGHAGSVASKGEGDSPIASFLPLAPRRSVGARCAPGAFPCACRRQAEAGAVRARGAIEDTDKVVGPTVVDCPCHTPNVQWVIAFGLGRVDATPRCRARLACRAGRVLWKAELDGTLA